MLKTDKDTHDCNCGRNNPKFLPGFVELTDAKTKLPLDIAVARVESIECPGEDDDAHVGCYVNLAGVQHAVSEVRAEVRQKMYVVLVQRDLNPNVVPPG